MSSAPSEKSQCFAWVVRNLSKSASNRMLPLKEQRFNPRPAGVMQEGSAKEVLTLLQGSPDRWFTFSQIMASTGRTSKSLDWACIFLRSMGYVECSRGDGRNQRYLRYRFLKNENT